MIRIPEHMDLSFITEMSDFFNKKLTYSVENFLKKALTDKGYDPEDLLKKRMFPKIKQVREGEWTHVYVDDGTDNGDRVVSYKMELNINDYEKSGLHLHSSLIFR